MLQPPARTMEYGGAGNNFGKLFARRHTHQLTIENRDNLLTSSLPSAVLKSELRAIRLSPRPSIVNESLVEEEFIIEDMEENSFLNCSFSGGSSLLNLRPRSASLHNNVATTSGLRRTLRTMSGRGRPSSVSRSKSSRSSLGSMSSDHLEARAVTSKVETAFATVRKQLTELSLEDTLLQERMNKLSSEIAAIQRYVASLNPAKQVSQTARDTFPIVSGKHTLAPPLSGNSWEESDGTKSLDDDDTVFLRRPRYLSLQGSGGNDGNDSLGSCSGSLADSEGSVSSPSGLHSACSILVVDHDKGMSVTTPTGRPLKSITGYEDDVFLS